MPKKQPKVRRVIETEVIDQDEQEDKVPQYFDDDVESEEVRRMMGELGADEAVKIKVSRLTKDGPQYCFVSDEPIQDLEETLARDPRFPDGGKFAVKIYVNGMLRLAKTLNIAPRFNPMLQPSGLAGPGMYASPQDTVIRLLEGQLTELRAELRSMRTVAPASSAVELAQAVSALRQIEAGQGSSVSEVIKTSIELAKMMNGVPADDWKSQALSAAKEFLPLILRGPANPAGQQPTLAPGVPVMPSPEQVNTPVQPSGASDELLKLGIAELKQKCKQGASPEFYVEALVTYNDREPYGSIFNRIVTSEFDAFAALDPEIKSPVYQPFFRSIYDELREFYKTITDRQRSESEEPNPVAVSRGGKDGNVADGKPNGGARTGSGR